MYVIDKIKNILLEHQEKENRITSSEIAIFLGIVEDDTHAKTRSLILESAKKHKLPLAANTTGYYLITNSKEFNDYIANLNSRIAGIEERKQIITENYNNYKGD